MSSADVSKALTTSVDAIGRELLAQPEDQWFERKSRRIEPRKLADALVGFANADGGVIVVGLAAGAIEGVAHDPRRRNELMQAAFDFTEPTVHAQTTSVACVRSDGVPDELLVFEVTPGDSVHATVRDEVFLRVGDENRRLSYAQRRELIFDKGQAAYEVELCDLTLADVDRKLLRDYSERVGHPDGPRLMRARGLAMGDRLTVAGALLFAKNPGRDFPNAHIRVSRFDGRERGLGSRQKLRSDVRIEGPVPKAVDAARLRVQQVQPTRRALAESGAFDDIPLVPEDAWLEGIVNAAVHRSYSLSGDHIHVDVFDDRIEIESPGRFPGVVDVSDLLNITRFARNPRVARVCADLRIGQELGEGIRRIVEEMRLAGLHDPLYHQTAGSVQLTLSTEPTERSLDARLAPESHAIVAAVRQAGQMSTGDVAQLIAMARPATIRRLNALRAAGIIEWVGKSSQDPRAYWRIAPR